MVCSFNNWNAKVVLLRASMVVTYYIKLFRTGVGRHNGILISLVLLAAEAIVTIWIVNCLIFSICYFWLGENDVYKTFTQIENDHRQEYFQIYDIAIIIWYLVESFGTITLCSVRSLRFADYMLSAKIWFAKTSTRIVKYESRIDKSNSDGSVS